MILERQTWTNMAETVRVEKNDHGAGYFLRVKGSAQAQHALIERVMSTDFVCCEWSRTPHLSDDNDHVLTIRAAGRRRESHLSDVVARNLCELGYSRLA